MSSVRNTKKGAIDNDFKQLELDLQGPVQIDARKIVNAAHRKSLLKSDKSTRKQRSWNNLSLAMSGNSENQLNGADLLDQSATPSNSYEFEKHWRKISSKSTQERFEYLKCLGGSVVAQMFKSEIVFGLLGEIVSTLKEFDSSSVIDFVLVVEILQSMSQAKRFSLTLQFLSGDEKLECHQLFEKLWKAMGDKLQDLADSGISEITINNLMACYNVNIHS